MDNLTTVFFFQSFAFVQKKSSRAALQSQTCFFFSVTLTVFTPTQHLFIYLLFISLF